MSEEPSMKAYRVIRFDELFFQKLAFVSPKPFRPVISVSSRIEIPPLETLLACRNEPVYNAVSLTFLGILVFGLLASIASGNLIFVFLAVVAVSFYPSIATRMCRHFMGKHHA